MSITLPSHLSLATMVVPSSRGLLVWSPGLKGYSYVLDQFHGWQSDDRADQNVDRVPVGNVAYVRQAGRTGILVSLIRSEVDVGIIFPERTWPTFKAIPGIGGQLFLLPESLPVAKQARKLGQVFSAREEPGFTPGIAIRVKPESLEGLAEPQRWANPQFAEAAERFKLAKARGHRSSG